MQFLQPLAKKNDAGVITENPKQVTIDSINTVIANQKIENAKQKSINSMKIIMVQQKIIKSSNHQIDSNASQSTNLSTTTKKNEAIQP